MLCTVEIMAKSAESGEEESYRERKITQTRELKTLLWGLDLDEGIRFMADYPTYERGAFVFVTKCDDKYCINVKDKLKDESTGEFVPGGKEQWKYFETAEAAWNFISKLLKHPFEAYYY
jgi:hypothetical protein